MTTSNPHKAANQVTRARKLVEALDGLGGDIRTTKALAKAMKPSQWAEFAVNVADITPPSDETIAMLEDRVKADDNFQRMTHGNQSQGGRSVGAGNGPRFDPVFAGFPDVK
jgi:hypothetical protein